jgi:hypothetical protein
MVTVRELARSQGFPDWFVFHSRTDDVLTVMRIKSSIISHAYDFITIDAQANWECSFVARGASNWNVIAGHDVFYVEKSERRLFLNGSLGTLLCQLVRSLFTGCFWIQKRKN